MKYKISLVLLFLASCAFAQPAGTHGSLPWMTSGTAALASNALVVGASDVTAAVTLSNKLIVAFWPKIAAPGPGPNANACHLVIEVSPDGTTWHRNPNLLLVLTNFPSLTNHYVSAAIDGAPFARLRVFAADTNLTIISTDVTWTTKE